MDLLPRIAIPALVLFTLLSLSTIFILLPANHTQHNLTLPTTKPRIVVSLASFPGRIIRINNTIHSLASQSLKPDLILLSLPHNGTVVRFSKPLVASSEEIQLLKYLNDRFPGLFQVHETVDYGSATKLLGALEREKDDDTVIVTVDDDTLYHPNTIQALIPPLLNQPAFNSNGPRGPTCFVCQVKSKWWPWIYWQRNPGECKGFLNAFAAAAYRVSFFTENNGAAMKHVFDHNSWKGAPAKGCRLHDDVWLSGVLYKTSGGRVRPQVVKPGFESVVEHLPWNEFAIHNVDKGESEYRDPCLAFFDWLQ